jgi:hypothetical protein
MQDVQEKSSSGKGYFWLPGVGSHLLFYGQENIICNAAGANDLVVAGNEEGFDSVDGFDECSGIFESEGVAGGA